MREGKLAETQWSSVVGTLSDPELEKTCGVDSLYLALASADRGLSYSELAEAIPLDLAKGTSLRGLQAGLASLGVNDSVALRKPGDKQDASIALLHVVGEHYVAQIGSRGGRSVVVDPVGKVIEIEEDYLGLFLSGWRLTIE